MITEKMMEDAVSSDPEKYLGEKGLKLIARQYHIGDYIFDLLFEDRHGARLIVELQKGTLDRNHTYKILDYYDAYKDKNPNEFIELMVIANKITYERRKRLNSHGIAWKEIPEIDFKDILIAINEKDNSEISPVEKDIKVDIRYSQQNQYSRNKNPGRNLRAGESGFSPKGHRLNSEPGRIDNFAHKFRNKNGRWPTDVETANGTGLSASRCRAHFNWWNKVDGRYKS